MSNKLEENFRKLKFISPEDISLAFSQTMAEDEFCVTHPVISDHFCTIIAKTLYNLYNKEFEK